MLCESHDVPEGFDGGSFKTSWSLEGFGVLGVGGGKLSPVPKGVFIFFQVSLLPFTQSWFYF